VLERPLSHRIYFDPAYTEVVRLIGYRGLPYPISQEETDRLNEKYGKEKMLKAADELIEYDTTAKRAKLKDNVRKLSRSLLGPAPEEWDEFYANVINPPPNPYKSVELSERSTVAQTQADNPAELTELELIGSIHGRRLRKLLLSEHQHFQDYPSKGCPHETPPWWSGVEMSPNNLTTN